MTLIAFDLALSGPTGWVIWDDSYHIHDRHYEGLVSSTLRSSFADNLGPIRKYGQFECRSSKNGILKDYEIINQLGENISKLMTSIRPDISHIAYEYTDWHRPIFRANITRKQQNIEYAIERKAQWSLGMANAIMICLVSTIRFPIKNVMKIGAIEAKSEFGATSKKKEDVARLIAAEHDRFRIYEHKNGLLFDDVLEQPISFDISDAICLASVAAARIRQRELAMD